LRSFCGVEVADQWERRCSDVKRSVVSAGADARAPLARFIARLPTWQMVMAQRHAAMRLYRLRSRARKGADGRIPAEKPGQHGPTPARSGLRALLYSLRLWCEGLEEKFLERGAPAPLSFQLKHWRADFHVGLSLVLRPRRGARRCNWAVAAQSCRHMTALSHFLGWFRFAKT